MTNKPSLAEQVIAALRSEEIETGRVITLEKVEAELEAKGFPPDSHDHLHA